MCEIRRTELNIQHFDTSYLVLRWVVMDGIRTELPSIVCEMLGQAEAVALEDVQNGDCDVAEIRTVTRTEYSHSRYERVSG